LDLSTEFKEQAQNNTLQWIIKPGDDDIPSLYDMVRLIKHAKSDSSIKGMYILCGR
jgi:protease-4